MRWLVINLPAALLLTMNFVLCEARLGPASADERPQMSQNDLRGLFPGEFHVVVNGFLEVQVIAKEDGSLFARQTDKSDSGSWEIRSGQLCITFSKWLKGATHCADVIEDGGWYRTANLAFRRN
jgi:hypothetical protein